MLESIPSQQEMTSLIGESLYDVWLNLCAMIDSKYEMNCTWNNGGKKWTYEYKYHRGGKTLCALYAKENCFGFMVIFGKDERTKFEENRSSYSITVQDVYDNSQTFHDGKWMMFELTDTSLFEEMEKLLLIKRKQNKKTDR